MYSCTHLSKMFFFYKTRLGWTETGHSVVWWLVRWPRRTNGVLGQKLLRVRATTSLRCVEANYGVSGQQLRRVESNYGVSRQITACRGKLRRVGENYVVSGATITRLRRVQANYVVSRQIVTFHGMQFLRGILYHWCQLCTLGHIRM